MKTPEELYRELQLMSLGSMRNYTCILLTDTSNYKVHGTGVFIQIQEHYFLVSAAHVFDRYRDLFIFLSEDYETIRPGGTTFYIGPANRERDGVDVAVLKLNDNCVQHILRRYSFVQADDLAINHTFKDGECYTFLGYPATKSKVLYKTDIFDATTFFHFTSPAKLDQYSNLNRNPAVNVVAHYNKKSAYNSRNGTFGTGPDLHGISGCGLWYTDPSHLISGTVKPKLTAIMTDWPVKNRSVIIGTRIDVITGIIKKYLDVDFPESSVVRVH
ncbi:hypothetical protein ACHRV5_01985 [Flavobacterium sp. FlaQc-52]|uniref:hypothetical protein n=1 Tax=unclassified Flavobacterium TaxID=196869 RepID=UPI00100C281A|nr:hypothetical protein [Flavobacterium sp. YO12]RXM45504.1 hypothetical protein BOW57_05245 [Flavobacterium sp. YO64]RXM49532.1 hypothetical protein BOW55_00360 [Flavobacterium sp. YO12]